MNSYAKPCDAVPLNVLLSDETSSNEFRIAAEHVESCEACQRQLTTLAAGAACWREATEFLSDDWGERWQPDLSQSATRPPDETSRRAAEESVSDLLGPPSHPELLGRLGRYDVERVIGSGGMGIVLKAHDGELNRPVAIKVLAGHLAHVGAARERFAREGRAAAAVVHEHVVAIHNVETDGRVPFLVMQYVPGRSLQARVDAEGPLAVEEILRIGMQAAAGLAAAHAQGLVHRDVKPSNILLEESVERAVLTDFGLARTMDDASLTHTGVLAGTPHYMSPEQAQGEAIDHRSDLFSLGAVLYFMAAGRPPFRADGALAVLNRICRDRHRPVWQSNKNVPDELSDLIDRLLAKKPSRRPPTAADVAEELAAILSRVQRFGSGRRRFGLLRNRRVRRRLVGAVAATLVSAVIIGALWRTPDTPPPATLPAAVDLPVANRPAAPDAAELAVVAEEFAQANHDIVGELSAVQQQVDQAEQAEYVALPGEDPWEVEVEAIHRELSQLESETAVAP
jgi:hypothetical protein